MNKLLGLFAVIGAMLAAGAASAADKVVFGTNWLAQGGHGGFYQALADGTYEKYGLDVEIRMGGPQVNTRPMLAAGRLDFLMGGNLLLAFDNVRNDIPTTVVAAIFQKDPQAMMAHKGRYKDFAALTEAPEILISKDGQFSLWKWMVESHGFRDEQLRPYGYNMAQFLTNPAKPMCSCSPITAGAPTAPSSKPATTCWKATRIWCSASSMPRSRAGTTSSMATAPPPIRRSSPQTRK
jgi:NitT/TauT family transport system substrate-binding protein